jgi:hypothetical protein
MDRHLPTDKPRPLAEDRLTGGGMRVVLERKPGHPNDHKKNADYYS